MYIMQIFHLSNVCLCLRMLLIIYFSPNYHIFQSLTLEESNARIGTFDIGFLQVRTGVPHKKENLPDNNIPFHTAMIRNFDKFYIKNGILFRETRNGESTSKKHQIVLPYSCRKTVLKYLHTDMGHAGR